MANIISIKLTKAGARTGPFRITTLDKKILVDSVSKIELIRGISIDVPINTKSVIVESIGKCKLSKVFELKSTSITELASIKYTESNTGCIWRHLTDPGLYNCFYGNIEPYIIEYPISYQYQDEILQSVKDYTKAYKHIPMGTGLFNDVMKIEVDSEWFNKAILYNGQQSSGLLELVAKPLNNLSAYNKYPIFNSDSKTIVYTKSDNYYHYNTFWALNKSSQEPLFTPTCINKSFDKAINQNNMDYSPRSFKKAPLRAKDLKIRHILDNSNSIHLVSQFIIAPSQLSYK